MRLRLFAGIISAGLFFLAFLQIGRLDPAQERGVLPTNPPTPYIHYISSAVPHRRVLVVHGLDSSKDFMQIFCSALADAGFEVYAIDMPGHGSSTVGFNGLVARAAVGQAAAYIKPDVAIGHSMGAAVLIDLAHDMKFPALVLISPVPTQVNSIEFEHTLVTTELWDLPPVSTFAPELQGVDMRKFNWGMHSSALINPGQIREIVNWLGGNTDRVRTSARLAWLGLMFASAIAFAIVLLPPRSSGADAGIPPSSTEILVSFVFAGGVSVALQRFVIVLQSVRLYATDYLVSFLFVAGLVLLLSLVLRQQFIKLPTGTGPSTFAFSKAIGIAAYAIIVLGVLSGSRLIHMTLSDGRWWRFIVIAAASFPLFLFDEIAVRYPGKALRNAALGIGTRALLSAWILTGVLIFNRESAFLVLLLALLPLFWLALWFFTGVVRRNIQNPAATALFAALVQGWMFAAWFVTV